MNPKPIFLCLLCFLCSVPFSGCSKPGPSADQQHGQALFEMHCAPCHETPPPDLLKQPPKLEGLFNSKTLPSGSPATDEQVRMVIVDGLRTMPAFQGRLQDQDVRGLIAYLHYLK